MNGVMPRTVLIMQARMGSSRLPGKSMMDMAGQPLVHRIIERVKRCETPDAIVLATTEKPEDDPLAKLAADCGISCFRGAENDLVKRYLDAAAKYGAELILRLPADNVAPEPVEIDRMACHHMTQGYDYSTNLVPILDNGYPDGIGVEAINQGALAWVGANVDDPRRREHPHLNFFDFDNDRPADPDRFYVGTIACPREFARPDLVLDVNTHEQYVYCRSLYEYLYPRNPQFHITDVIQWHDTVWVPQYGQPGFHV
tara:strand:+ start:21024 stop:21791 length:768 start_codon:yes stop_codon:yes gene_type:complete